MKRTALAILAAFFLLGVLPAGAQTPAVDDVLPLSQSKNEIPDADKVKRTEYANAYYKRCMAQRLDIYTEATQDLTCMCHTVHMLKALKTPELEVMGTGKGTVNVNPKRLNVEVYAPCVEFAIMELEQARCYASQMVKETAQTQEQYDGMCDCYTEELGRSVRQTAVPQLSAIAEEPQGVTDPVNDIMNSYNHMRERHQILKACVDRYDPRKQH